MGGPPLIPPPKEKKEVGVGCDRGPFLRSAFAEFLRTQTFPPYQTACTECTLTFQEASRRIQLLESGFRCVAFLASSLPLHHPPLLDK